MAGNSIGGWGMPTLSGNAAASGQGNGGMSIADYLRAYETITNNEQAQQLRAGQLVEQNRHNKEAEQARNDALKESGRAHDLQDYERRLAQARKMATDFVQQRFRQTEAIERGEFRSKREYLQELKAAISASKTPGYNTTQAVQDLDNLTGAYDAFSQAKAAGFIPGLNGWQQLSNREEIKPIYQRSAAARNFLVEVAGGKNPEAVIAEMMKGRQSHYDKIDPYVGGLNKLITASNQNELTAAQTLLRRQAAQLQDPAYFENLVQHNLETVTGWQGNTGGKTQEATPESMPVSRGPMHGQASGNANYAGTITSNGKTYAVPTYGTQDTTLYDKYNAKVSGIRGNDDTLMALRKLQKELLGANQPTAPASSQPTTPQVSTQTPPFTPSPAPSAAPPANDYKTWLNTPGAPGYAVNNNLYDANETPAEQDAGIQSLTNDVTMGSIRKEIADMKKDPERWQKFTSMPDAYSIILGHFTHKYPNHSIQTASELLNEGFNFPGTSGRPGITGGGTAEFSPIAPYGSNSGL